MLRAFPDSPKELLFVQSVVEEREKYVPEGWTKPTEFSISDIRMAASYAKVRSFHEL